MNNLLSIGAILLAGLAVFYAHFNKTVQYEAETVICVECVELSKAVEELKIEINHLHELNIELGDNLNDRIDQVATGTAALMEDAVATANAAASRAEDAAGAAQEWYNKIMEWAQGFEWPSLPDVSLPWSRS